MCVCVHIYECEFPHHSGLEDNLTPLSASLPLASAGLCFVVHCCLSDPLVHELLSTLLFLLTSALRGRLGFPLCVDTAKAAFLKNVGSRVMQQPRHLLSRFSSLQSLRVLPVSLYSLLYSSRQDATLSESVTTTHPSGLRLHSSSLGLDTVHQRCVLDVWIYLLCNCY